MNDVCELMAQKEFFSHGTGVETGVISNAEIQLGVRFADDYRSYLRELGYASYYGHELTGLGCSARLDTVTVTQEARALNPDVPESMYVLEELHIDGVIVWQSPDGKVYISIPGIQPVERYQSLAEYVEFAE